MTKKVTVSAGRSGYAGLVKAIESANSLMAGRAAAVVNQALVIRNWIIGSYIIEYEQGGADRARYGGQLLANLAADLLKKGLKGLDTRTLRDCRLLVQRYPQIRETVSPEFVQVEFATAGMDNKLFVSRYLTALPKVEQLKALVDADRAYFEQQHPTAKTKRKG